MRDIARRAELSLGSTYYHFRSKDDLVFAFYADTHRDAAAQNETFCKRTKRFEERLRNLVEFKLSQLEPYREMCIVLGRNAADPASPLSPFSAETREIREGAIEILRVAIETSDLEVHPKLRAVLPRLLWLFQLAVVFLWTQDRSVDQQRTRRVIRSAVRLFGSSLPITATRLPGIARGVNLTIALLDHASFWEGPDDTTR